MLAVFSLQTPPTLVVKMQNVIIQLVERMVMLHIKFVGIAKGSNMVANILPADTPPPP